MNLEKIFITVVIGAIIGTVISFFINKELDKKFYE